MFSQGTHRKFQLYFPSRNFRFVSLVKFQAPNVINNSEYRRKWYVCTENFNLVSQSNKIKKRNKQLAVENKKICGAPLNKKRFMLVLSQIY